MKKRHIVLGAATLMIGAMTMGGGSILAYQGDPNVQGPNYIAERHDAITSALESGDYEAWAEQMQGNGRLTQVINADNFAQFAEAHRLTLAGDTEAAQQIRTELGLGLQNGAGQGQGQGLGQGNGKGQGNGQMLRDGSGLGQQ